MMHEKVFAALACAAFLALVPVVAYCAADAPAAGAAIDAQSPTKVVPGRTGKAEITALFGKPWRVVQFNDCGEAMDDQADETWEYRGSDANGGFRLHIEFNDRGVVHLFAKIPDQSPGDEGTTAKVAPSAPMPGMSM
jgi:hypothetical protein